MRKLFLSSIVLLIFSLSLFVFQVSCQKSSFGNTNNSNSNGKICYIKDFSSGVNEVWTCNLDGTNNVKIPITPPSGYEIGYPHLSPDGTSVIVILYQTIGNGSKIVSYDTNGSFLRTIVDNDSTSVGFDGYYFGSVN